jgi:hypothetical protein
MEAYGGASLRSSLGLCAPRVVEWSALKRVLGYSRHDLDQLTRVGAVGSESKSALGPRTLRNVPPLIAGAGVRKVVRCMTNLLAPLRLRRITDWYALNFRHAR